MRLALQLAPACAVGPRDTTASSADNDRQKGLKKECCEGGCASPQWFERFQTSIGFKLWSFYHVSTMFINFHDQMISGVLADLDPVRQVFRVLLKRWTPQQIRSLRLQFGDLHLVCHARLSQVGWLSTVIT